MILALVMGGAAGVISGLLGVGGGIMFVPALLIWSSMTDCAPLPIATSVITAETPMIMPSIVRPVRILLRPRALNAIRKVMTGDISVPRVRPALF